MCLEKVAAVVHTERDGACRIISMRHARKTEKEAYYGNSQNDGRRTSRHRIRR
jgi:uncharacterized DUF497 family protein